MQSPDELPNGWERLGPEAGALYDTRRVDRFINPDASVVVEVLPEDGSSGPVYQVEVLHNGTWTTLLADCTYEAALECAEEFMRRLSG